VEVYIHSYLTLALDGIKWSASTPAVLPHARDFWHPYRRFGHITECPYWESNYDSSVVQLVS